MGNDDRLSNRERIRDLERRVSNQGGILLLVALSGALLGYALLRSGVLNDTVASA
jgi:hypothetical protein